jgi:hypothetical protein
MYLGYVLLGMSLWSLTVYLASLSRLLVHPRRRGLIRTALCRVLAACLYVVISMATLTRSPSAGMISIGVFVIIQFMWQANSIADVLLTRRDNKETRGVVVDGLMAKRVRTESKHRRANQTG